MICLFDCFEVQATNEKSFHFRHSIGGDVHAPGLYVHLEPDACFIAAGIWLPPSEPLAAIRQAIMDNTVDCLSLACNYFYLRSETADGQTVRVGTIDLSPK